MPISNPDGLVSFNAASLQTDRPICFPGGRLTLSSTNPIADGSNATTFYYLPYAHGIVPFWNNAGQYWEYRPIPENGITITRSTDNPRVIDVYAQAYENLPNTFGIDVQTWTNDTTRAIPLVRKDGILCLSYNTQNTPLRTYLGSIRFIGATGAARMVDSETQRFVFNAYNQVNKRVIRYEPAGSWTYSINAWRPLHNSTLNRIEVVDGIGTGILDLSLTVRANTPSGSYTQGGISIDNINNPDVYTVSNVGDHNQAMRLCRSVGVGYHYAQALEFVFGGGMATYISSNTTGLQGVWQC
jgi:hypothetical protein